MRKWTRRQVQFVNLECAYCQRPFQLRRWTYIARLKEKPNQKNFYCSKACYIGHIQDQKENRKKNIYKPTHCRVCGKKMQGKDYEFWVRDEHRYYSECYNCRYKLHTRKLMIRKKKQKKFIEKWKLMKKEIFNESK